MLSAQALPVNPLAKHTPAYAAPSSTGDYFAFARVKGNFSLVQVSHATPASALTAVDVKLFRHEFVSLFRFVECQTLHPADITILEVIDDNATRYEEETGTVFLARELMDLMSRMSDPRRMMMHYRTRYAATHRQRQR